MTKESLMTFFKFMKVNSRHYSLDGGLPSNKYVFSEEEGKWKIYYCEGSEKLEEKIFTSEGEAIEYFMHFISVDANVRKEEEISKFNNPIFDEDVIFSKEILQQLLDDLQVLPRYYSLTGGLPDDRYVLSEENRKWHVYYTEKGSKEKEKIFNSEDEACRYFIWFIAVDPSVRK
jgi:DNA-directed RNA polymerase subunit F